MATFLFMASAPPFIIIVFIPIVGVSDRSSSDMMAI